MSGLLGWAWRAGGRHHCTRAPRRPRGRRVGGPELVAFVEGLDIGDDAKARLVALTPATYTGIADRLVDELPPR